MPAQHERNPIILVHGIDDTGRVFKKMGACLRETGSEVHVVNYSPNNGDLGLDRLAEQIAGYIEDHLDKTAKVDIVAFSMGGLVCRYYIQKLGGWHRVQRLVTISSPHKGTLTGYFRRNDGARQLRPGSDFLQDLNSDGEWAKKVQWTSIWTTFDLMIFPADSSRIDAGKNIHIPVLLHPWMLESLRVIRAVQEITEAPLPAY